jgi:siroheme synthase-like protein
MPSLYPACLNLAQREVLVVGGGAVALRKVTALLRAGACVTVVSPKLCRGLSRLAGRPRLKILRRAYRAADVRNQWLLIAATDQAAVNVRVCKDAARARVFCNVVDQPELCTFQAPAVMQRGLLQIAISTGGASPALARDIRRRLEADYGPACARLLNALMGLRRRIRRKYPDDPARRRRLLESFLKSSAPALLLKQADPKAFRREVGPWKSL